MTLAVTLDTHELVFEGMRMPRLVVVTRRAGVATLGCLLLC